MRSPQTQMWDLRIETHLQILPEGDEECGGEIMFMYLVIWFNMYKKLQDVFKDVSKSHEFKNFISWLSNT